MENIETAALSEIADIILTEKMVSYRVIESDIEEIQREYPKI